jgi:hypothetical protein
MRLDFAARYGRKDSCMRLNTPHLLIVLSLSLFVGMGVGQQRFEAHLQEGYATTSSGIRIHYLQSGPDTSSRAIVLIPGWRLPASLWSKQLVEFSGMTRVIAVDPRSQGASTKALDKRTEEIEKVAKMLKGKAKG